MPARQRVPAGEQVLANACGPDWGEQGFLLCGRGWGGNLSLGPGGLGMGDLAPLSAGHGCSMVVGSLRKGAAVAVGDCLFLGRDPDPDLFDLDPAPS